MISIRARINIIVLLVVVGISWFGYQLVSTYERYETAQGKIAELLELRGTVAFLDVNTYDPKLSNRIQQKRKRLGNDPRAGYLSEIIQAYKERQQPTLKRRVYAFLASEKKNYEQNLLAMRTAQQELRRNAALTILVPLIGLLLILHLVRVKVFRSIDRLSRRMMDFLVDRYSFQFSEPENTEIGALQRTFNSLVQRVINNMDELKSLDQAKSDFLSITSHELRTPMTSIKGSLSLLTSGVMGQLDPQAERLLKIAETETDRLIRLINDLLDLAKIEAGKLPLACNWMPWDDILQQSVQGLLGLARTAQVNLSARTEPGLEVFIDKDRMQQILTNLISNAIKFSPEGGTVSVYCAKAVNGEVVVQIQDQGRGIPPEDQELIFQKFRQSSSPENPIVKGTGLGLTIARALVEEHGGAIGVRSERGRGATFYFTLPKWRDDQSAGSSPLQGAA